MKKSGFMSGRHISNNIKLVLDLIDYSDLINDDSYIFLLDFHEAFDTVEHPFIFYCLEKYGFGTYFCKAMSTLYANGNSSVKLSNGTTAQAFCHYVKSSNIEVIQIAGRNILLTQLADDSALFLKNALQVKLAIKIINIFSNASGLCLNLNKCELFAIKSCDITSIDGIPVKEKVNYLGILQINTKDVQLTLTLC